jgi:hypothetical protein
MSTLRLYKIYHCPITSLVGLRLGKHFRAAVMEKIIHGHFPEQTSSAVSAFLKLEIWTLM